MDQEKESDSGVKFQKDTRSSEFVLYPETPKIILWLIKYSRGLIQNEEQANYFLFGFVVLVIIISLVLVFSKGVGPNTLEPSGPAIEEAGSPADIAP